MGRDRWLTAVRLIAALAIMGCGNARSTQPNPQAGSGSLSVRISWPAPSEDGRLVPAASKSVRVDVVPQSAPDSPLTLVINRPTASGAIDNVPAGPATVRAAAYPEADGRGVAQATTAVQVTIAAGATSDVSLTLASVIRSLRLAPDPASVAQGNTLQAIATPLDESGAVVLVPINGIDWSVVGGGTFVTVDSWGLVAGVAAGSAVVRATEKESGVTGDLTVTVVAPSSLPLVAVTPPTRIEVLPIFFVPKGEADPTSDQMALLAQHLEWARQRYHEMLGQRDTFSIAAGGARVVRGVFTTPYYNALPEDGCPQFVSEVLANLGLNRFTAPYVFLIVVLNGRSGKPFGGARPLNGGYNTGAGVVSISQGLFEAPNLQSTLQHELGHSFGLPHVDVYGYPMSSNASIMSYNPAHHTNGLTPSPTPGILIPEDIRGLALNDRAFPSLTFDAASDIPAGYTISSRRVYLGPQNIPGQFPYALTATTPSGEAYGSSVQRMLLTEIKLSAGPGITYDSQTMWHSGVTTTGTVSLDVTFPFPVQLTGMGIYSQHSGVTHAARGVLVQVRSEAGPFQDVAQRDLPFVNATIGFPATVGQTWRLVLTAVDNDNMVVLRGMRFFSGSDEIFPPFIPYEGPGNLTVSIQ